MIRDSSHAINSAFVAIGYVIIFRKPFIFIAREAQSTPQLQELQLLHQRYAFGDTQSENYSLMQLQGLYLAIQVVAAAADLTIAACLIVLLIHNRERALKGSVSLILFR